MAKTVTLYRSSRDILKVDLIASRGIYFPGRGLQPICPICNLPLLEAPHMHEALITKGMVNGHPMQDLINDRHNCVLRHGICPRGLGQHTGGVGGPVIFERCARQIVEWEGYDETLDWLKQMEETFPDVATEARRRFEALQWEPVG